MSKPAVVMENGNAPNLRTDENRVAIEDKRSLGEKLAQAFAATEERLTHSNWETIVGNENEVTVEPWCVCKNSIEQFYFAIQARSAVVLLPSRDDAAPHCDV
jgi:hypothetical protein